MAASGQEIFFSEADRHHFYFLLGEGRKRYNHRIHAFCQMTNHVHLAIQVGETPLSQIMQNVSFRYTRHINSPQKRVGHLFQGRYKAILIDKDNYLLELVRYIHCNPVRAKICENPADYQYQWSSHNAYLGIQKYPLLITKGIFSRFDRNKSIAKRLYTAFVQARMDEGYRKEFHSGVFESRILGNDRFSDEVLALADEQRRYRWLYDQLIASVCLIYGIDNNTLLEPGKRQPAAEARAVAALLVQENNHTALTDLGKIFSRDLSALCKAAGRISG
jgi:putative transposase